VTAGDEARSDRPAVLGLGDVRGSGGWWGGAKLLLLAARLDDVEGQRTPTPDDQELIEVQEE